MMSGAGPVRYVYDGGAGMEAIVCQDSRIAYPLHTHASVFTAGLVLAGPVVLVCGGASRVCANGECFLIPPHLPHSFRGDGPYSLLSLCVPADMLRLEAAQDGLRRLLEAVPEPEALAGLLASLRRLPPPAALPPSVAAAERQIARSPERGMQVREMAQAAYMSQYHFIRSFRRSLGLTPHQLQIQHRVRKAQRLLDGPCGIAEAALAAGFCDQSHLTRHFKRLLGLTPAVYRASRTVLPPLR